VARTSRRRTLVTAARSRWSFRRPLAALAAVALACTACAERITVPPDGPDLHAVSGDSQMTGVPGRPFAPFVVQVGDSTGTTLAGRLVVFAVERGGGRFAGETSIVVATDSNGRAAATLTAGAADYDTTSVVARNQGSATPSLGFVVATLPLAEGSVAVGLSFACGVATTGAAYCWGNNYAGQLGTGDTMASRTPAPVSGGLAFRSVSAGDAHACGVATSGAVYCWGSNHNGPLGVTGVSQSLVPIAVPGIPAMRAVAAGAFHTCGIATNGRAWCWGLNSSGQIGNGEHTVSASAIPPTQVAYDTTYQSIGAGYAHTCALATSGAVLCWGNGTSGQLGNGNPSSWTPWPTPILGGRVYRALGVAPSHACAVTTGGEAYCWGNNYSGAIGDGSVYTVRSTPTAVLGGLAFATIAAGDGITCGVTASGTAHCWGRNGSGQLGDGTRADRTTPVAVTGGLQFRIVRPGYYATCAAAVSGAAYCWGATAGLGTGRGDISAVPVAVSGLSGVTALAAGGSHVCSLGIGGLLCWGSNARGQLGDGTMIDRFVPTLPDSPFTAQSLAPGPGDHSCAVVGSGGAFCWGTNTWGQLGDGSTASSPRPHGVMGGLAYQRIAVGTAHTCGLTVAGAAYCWGANWSYQLGDSTRTNASAPQAVRGGLTFKAIGAGLAHTCALATTGETYCWGVDSVGMMPNSWTPSLLAGGLVFDSLSVGTQHACGLTSAGIAYCWGSNSGGQLGTGSAGAVSPAPVAVSGGLAFRSLSAGGSHTCGITTSGAAFCWGYGLYGALGTGTTASAYTPVAVSGGLTFAKLSAGGAHTCGVTTLGVVYCWGSRGSGRLGDGFADYAPTPQPVTGGLTFRPAGEP